jgi:hypothetical protein
MYKQTGDITDHSTANLERSAVYEIILDRYRYHGTPSEANRKPF